MHKFKKILNSITKQGGVIFLFLVSAVLMSVPRVVYAGWQNYLIMFFALIPGHFAVFFSKLFAELSNTIFTSTLSHIATKTITGAGQDSAVFLSAWTTTRDWANMLIVIGLIGIAIATILNFEKYKAQKLLVPFIIVALLVNFSVVFTGLVIDASNVIMQGLLRGVGNEATTIVNGLKDFDRIVVTRALASLMSQTNAESAGWDSGAIWSLLTGIAQMLSLLGLMTILYAVVGISFLIAAILLIVRYALLAFLFIVSPLAFVFWVFPVKACKDLWENWWQHFLKWCFAGLGIAFSIRLSSDVLLVSRATLFTLLGDRDLSAQAIQSTIDQVVIILAVVVIILLVGLSVSMKVAPKLAGAVIGLAKTAGMTLATGGAALAGKLGMAGLRATAYGTGLDRAADKARSGYHAAKDWTTSKLESGGFMKKGTTKTNQRARAEAAMKQHTGRLQNLSNTELASMTTAESTVGVGRFSKKVYQHSDAARAAAAEVLKQRGKLDTIGARLDPAKKQEKQKAVLQNAKAHGLPVGEYVKLDASLAPLDDDKMAELRAKNPGKTKDELKIMACSEAYRRLDSSDVDKMNRADLTALAKDQTDTSGMAAKAREKMIKEGWQDDIEKEPEKLAKMLNDDKKFFNSGAIGLAASKDHRLAGYDEEGAILELKKAEVRKRHPGASEEQVGNLVKGIATTKDHREEATQAAAEKISADKAVDLSFDVQENWAERVSDEQIEKFLNNRRVTEKGKRAVLRGVIKGEKDGHIDSKKLNEFSAKDIAKNLEAKPKYTKEEMDKAEEDLKTMGVTTINDTTKKIQVDGNHKAKLAEVADVLDTETLKNVMEIAADEIKEAVSGAMVQNIAESVNAMKPDEFTEQLPEITKKLSAIPQPNIAGALNSLEPALKNSLRDKFMRTGAPAATEREATQKDLEEAEEARIHHIKALQSKGLMPLNEDIKDESLEYQKAVDLEKNEMKPKTIKSEMMEHIKQLRGEGHMMSPEDIDQENALRKIMRLSPLSLEQHYANAVDRKKKSVKPIETPIPGKTMIPLKPEEQKEAEQYFDKPAVEEHWQDLNDEEKESLEEVLKNL